jgi:putative SOS response-associated peptidase YedK
MCGRFRQTYPPETLAFSFATANPLINAAPRWNLAPKQDALAVVRGRDGTRRLASLRWGLIPYWAKDESIGMKCINARAENVATTPAFRDAYRERRCLIPADGFYEWRREGKLRLPYDFTLKGGAPMTLAGLWERWRQPGSGETLHTFTVLTTKANTLVGELHDRMPVILDPPDHAAWLGETEAEDLGALMRPYQAEQMAMRPVDPKLNDWRNDGPELIAN